MNFAETLLVAVRGCAVPVSYRGIGSANGNRMRLRLSHPVTHRVKSFILRSSVIRSGSWFQRVSARDVMEMS